MNFDFQFSGETAAMAAYINHANGHQNWRSHLATATSAGVHVWGGTSLGGRIQQPPATERASTPHRLCLAADPD